MIRNVTVSCASSDAVHQRYMDVAEETGIETYADRLTGAESRDSNQESCGSEPRCDRR